ncbi:6548_t:CDS:2 [Diversispora eburnea]|uniref:6548_t:CDS:1 n=1 Tax=Diversispora eburnea TaxID=1213867 RepID=A0A9N8V6U2_9GLOM|nr:6548_t:CDS:2 [Diversispora eburnea]
MSSNNGNSTLLIGPVFETLNNTMNVIGKSALSSASNTSSFLETLGESIVEQMLKDIREKEVEIPNNIKQEIKLLLDRIISRDVNVSKKKLKQRKEIELMEDTNLLLEPISKGTYIISFLAPIINKLFIKNKKSWRIKYGETCLKASAKDCNSHKDDDKRRSARTQLLH